MLNPARKASTHFQLILSMASHIGCKKRVRLQYGLTKNMGIGKLDLKTTLVPVQVVFTAMPMSKNHKMTQSGTITSPTTKNGLKLMKMRFTQVVIQKKRDIVDEYLTLMILQLWKN